MSLLCVFISSTEVITWLLGTQKSNSHTMLWGRTLVRLDFFRVLHPHHCAQRTEDDTWGGHHLGQDPPSQMLSPA